MRFVSRGSENDTSECCLMFWVLLVGYELVFMGG